MFNFADENEVRNIRYQQFDMQFRIESLEKFIKAIYVKSDKGNKHIRKEHFWEDEKQK